MKKIIKILTILIISFTLMMPKISALNIKVSEVKVLDKSDTITAKSVTADNLIINPSITFNNVSDYIIFKVSFKGSDINKYIIKNITDNNKSNYIKTSYNHDETLSDPLYITMKYEEPLQEENYSLKDITVTINLIGEDGEIDIPVIPSSSSSSSEDNAPPPSNPQTGGTITITLIIMAISIILLCYYFKYKKESTLMILILFVIAIPSTGVLAYESHKLNLTISAKNITIKKDTNPSKP